MNNKIDQLKNAVESFDPHIIRSNGRRHKLVSQFQMYYEYLAYLELFINRDLFKAKQAFYQFGLTDILHTENLNRDFLTYGISRNGNVLLSDSKELIEKYGKLTFPGYEERIAKGDRAIIFNTIQKFMIHDYKGIVKNIGIMEEKMVPKKSRKAEIPFFLFLKSLLEKDKDGLINQLNDFLSEKVRKKWMKNNYVLKGFTAFPALGFTKLAWQQGIEIEIESPYIPMEMMPIRPNDSYVDAYPFLWEMDRNELLEFELSDEHC